MNWGEIIWTAVGFVMTLLVLSYLLGDNPAFRIAGSLLIGVAAGYVAVVVIYQVVWPKLLLPVISGSMEQKLLALAPLLLGALLIFKVSGTLGRIGNISMAYLVGAGAAVAVTGAVMGTLFPQVNASIAAFGANAPGYETTDPVLQILEAGVILIGTISTLVYFVFGGKSKEGAPTTRPVWVEAIANIGGVFIAITFGALFAGVLLASLSALVERVSFIWTFIFSLVK